MHLYTWVVVPGKCYATTLTSTHFNFRFPVPGPQNATQPRPMENCILLERNCLCGGERFVMAIFRLSCRITRMRGSAIRSVRCQCQSHWEWPNFAPPPPQNPLTSVDGDTFAQ